MKNKVTSQKPLNFKRKFEQKDLEGHTIAGGQQSLKLTREDEHTINVYKREVQYTKKGFLSYE